MSVYEREDFGACDVAILKQVDKISNPSPSQLLINCDMSSLECWDSDCFKIKETKQHFKCIKGLATINCKLCSINSGQKKPSGGSMVELSNCKILFD